MFRAWFTNLFLPRHTGTAFSSCHQLLNAIEMEHGSLATKPKTFLWLAAFSAQQQSLHWGTGEDTLGIQAATDPQKLIKFCPMTLGYEFGEIRKKVEELGPVRLHLWSKLGPKSLIQLQCKINQHIISICMRHHHFRLRRSHHLHRLKFYQHDCQSFYI